MNDNEVKIVVMGNVGTGKSIISDYLTNCLEKYFAKENITQTGDDSYPEDALIRKHKVDELLPKIVNRGIKINIEERQMRTSIVGFKGELC